MAGVSSSAPSEASGPAAGYYFQIRYALLRALQSLKKYPSASISIERLEDVALEYDSAKVDLEQLKHSLDSGKIYSDSDKAVWRTLGNWSRLLASGLPSAGYKFVLTTNGKVASGSGLELLSSDRTSADVATALAKLIEVAKTSTNAQTKKDRDDFLALPEPVREAMMNLVTVVEDVPSLAALGTEIEDELGYVCERGELPRFRIELEGWWFDLVMTVWTKGSGATIPLLEIDARISFLRERYKRETLSLDAEEPALEPLDGRTFVNQIKAVKGGPERLQNAQRDYLKARAQRSKWLREFKIDPEDLSAYDGTLAENWQRKSAILKDELADTPNDDEKCKSGRALLGWAETQAVPIRSARAQFLTSGSYHALADELKVGWHPDFKKLFSG